MFNRRSNKNSTHFRIDSLFVGSFAGLTLLIGAFVVCSTFSIDSTNAVSESKQISVNLNETINISSYPASIDLTNCNPSTSNLCTANASITISSNYELGYSLYMNATNGSPTALTNSSTSPSSTIPSVTQAYSSANLPVNTWGYTGGTNKSSETGGYDCTTNYCPILAYSSNDDSYAPNRLIDSTDSATASRTKTITFGAKVDTTKPSGTYTTSVTFTAVGTPSPSASTMQDFNTSSCAAMSIGDTTTLTDSRDDNEYTIAKLADNNCWMTQNLALGSSTAMNLTQADSNVGSGGFTLPASVSEGDWSGSYTDPEFFNYAGNYPSQQATNKYGNFYNWPAATAGTNPSSGDSQYDICPKNWRLPSASTSATTSEFYTMLNNYISTGTWSSTYWTGVTTTNFTNAPVSLVFSGGYYEDLYGQGDFGDWWSSTAGDSYFAYSLYANSNGSVYPRSSDDKYGGNSIRCLIPGA